MSKKNVDVSDHYNAVAEDYFRQYQRENLYTSEEYPANYFRLQILTRELASSGLKSVYEVGVGEGTPLATMSSMGFDVAGCDITEAMVEKAKGNFKSQGLSEDLIQWGDIEDSTTLVSQLSGGQYDALIAAGVMPHVKNDEHTLRNMGMFVRPGGKVYIEFRNSLFSLFTFNRYTKEFVLDELLAGVTDSIKTIVAEELDKRLATDVPTVRKTVVNGKGPGYDAILSKFHNPFEFVETFEKCGFANPKIHWYHYHPAPPMLEGKVGEQYRRSAISLEHENSWRGYFLCSAGVVEADKI